MKFTERVGGESHNICGILSSLLTVCGYIDERRQSGDETLQRLGEILLNSN